MSVIPRAPYHHGVFIPVLRSSQGGLLLHLAIRARGLQGVKSPSLDEKLNMADVKWKKLLDDIFFSLESFAA